MSLVSVQFRSEGQSVELEPRELRGLERVGEPDHFELELMAPETVMPKDILGTPCAIDIAGDFGTRTIFGVVVDFVAVATAQAAPGRRYRLIVRSAPWVLTLRRRCRVFQHLSVPDIIATIIEESGVAKEPLVRELGESYPEREYVVQYLETDAAFVRRLCEEEGLWFRLDPGEQSAVFVLCDNVAGAPDALDDPLPLTEEAGLHVDTLRAYRCRQLRTRRTGWVTERDYNASQPALKLEGEAKAGTDHEQTLEVYRAPDHATDADQIATASQRLLESLRADADTVAFESNAMRLAPGRRFVLSVADDYLGSARPEGDHLVVAIEHAWRHEQAYHYRVTATPAAIAYRLPRITPRPRIHGLQSAIVTGAQGEEIHTDDAGRVRLRFFWDREGPGDNESSLPVRVLQPNLDGSLLIPRVGWEVWVAFEDGDPDRPYVLGRAYNGMHPPPLGLPANKTMTSIATPSTPGARCVNSIQYEDGAGKQGMNWNACSDLTRTIGNNMTTVTMGDESYWVGGSQHITVETTQKESVGAVRVMSADTQSINVGGTHELKTPEAMEIKIGSETVACATLMEFIGNPANAGPDLLASVLFTGAGFFLQSAGAQFALGLVKAAYEGVKETTTKGGVSGAVAVGKELVGMIPGVGGFVSPLIDVAEGAELAPWQAGKQPWQGTEEGLKGADEYANQEINSIVGGIAGIGAPAPGSAGPGHRIHKIAGPMVETIGGAYVVATPAGNKWTTLGASSFAIGGSHSTAAAKTNWLTLGLSRLSTGVFNVAAASIKRDLRGLTAAYGPYRVTASGKVVLVGKGDVKITAGAVTIDGKLVIKVGGSKVVVDGSGVTVKSPEISWEDNVSASEAHRG